jgi:hypothetical protein
MGEEMARLVGRLILMLVLGMPGSVSAAIAQGADCSGSDDSRSNLPRALVKGSPRLRGSDPVIAAAIEQAVEQSPTFRQLVSAINCTDGIVYVHYGTCGRNLLACLPLAVTLAGANRLLHIKVDRRRKGHHLMVVISHELRHAIELLSEPTVIDRNTAYNFYQRLTPIAGYTFETEAAIQTALNVDKELRKWAKQHQVVKPIRESASDGDTARRGHVSIRE